MAAFFCKTANSKRTQTNPAVESGRLRLRVQMRALSLGEGGGGLASALCLNYFNCCGADRKQMQPLACTHRKEHDERKAWQHFFMKQRTQNELIRTLRLNPGACAFVCR